MQGKPREQWKAASNWIPQSTRPSESLRQQASWWHQSQKAISHPHLEPQLPPSASVFTASRQSSSARCISAHAASACSSDSPAAAASRLPSSILPSSTATSEAVHVPPPTHSASRGRPAPTLSGPTVQAAASGAISDGALPAGAASARRPPGWGKRTSEPPPRPMLSTSGIWKLVAAPARRTARGAGRGRPPTSSPTSVVVPPTSITAPSAIPVSSAAPRRLLTGPDWKVATGTCRPGRQIRRVSGPATPWGHESRASTGCVAENKKHQLLPGWPSLLFSSAPSVHPAPTAGSRRLL